MEEPDELSLQLALAHLTPPDFRLPATSQEVTFARLFLTMDPASAYTEAGYPAMPNKAQTTAAALQLAAAPNIVERSSYYRRLIEAKYDIRTERICAEYAAAAFSDIGDMVDNEGELIPMSDMNPRARAAIKELTITTYPTGRTVTKVKLYDKMAALDALARMKGLFAQDNAQKATIELDVKRKAQLAPIESTATRVDDTAAPASAPTTATARPRALRGIVVARSAT